MEEKINHLDFWEKVEKTNPKYTKNANVKGNKITSISPQFQIKNVTEHFGIYGKLWGLKDTSFDYTLCESFGLVVFSATFFYPSGSFPIKNSISLFIDNAKTKIDDNFAKKLETDTLTKAISKLGFNADVFMGKFDDVRYVEEMNNQFNPPPPPPKPKAKDELIQKGIEKSNGDGDKLQQLIDKFDLTTEQLELINNAKNDNA